MKRVVLTWNALDPSEWLGGIVPCCRNCRHAKPFFGLDCHGPELALGPVDEDDNCEQHDPIDGITIQWLLEAEAVSEALALAERFPGLTF